MSRVGTRLSRAETQETDSRKATPRIRVMAFRADYAADDRDFSVY